MTNWLRRRPSWARRGPITRATRSECKSAAACPTRLERRWKMTSYPYRYAWRNNPVRAALYGRFCRIVVRGKWDGAAWSELVGGERAYGL